jgi:hypothetical protein
MYAFFPTKVINVFLITSLFRTRKYIYVVFQNLIFYFLRNSTHFLKICKSVLHRTIQINHQPDASIFQFIILTFVYSSTCFGLCSAHHQELNDCSGSLSFLPSYRGDRRSMFVVGPTSPTTNTARLSPRYESKTRGCHCNH